MSEILTLIILTLLPLLELRASIPYGVFQTSLSLVWVFLICTLVNILIAPIVFFFMNNLVHLFLKVDLVERYYQKTISRAQRKLQPYVKKYGVLGLAFFIGIPLPGTGAYTGALGAYFLGFKFRDLMMATIIGVLMAGLIVTLISVTGNTAFQFLIKRI